MNGEEHASLGIHQIPEIVVLPVDVDDSLVVIPPVAYLDILGVHPIGGEFRVVNEPVIDRRMGNLEAIDLMEMLDDLPERHSPEIEVKGQGDLLRIASPLLKAVSPREPVPACLAEIPLDDSTLVVSPAIADYVGGMALLALRPVLNLGFPDEAKAVSDRQYVNAGLPSLPIEGTGA